MNFTILLWGFLLSHGATALPISPHDRDPRGVRLDIRSKDECMESKNIYQFMKCFLIDSQAQT
ncbi:hypothetical protein QL093DRAFT_2518901 [Fusarium oxysporum]|nr:hypothetical protein QL093DRAFT_2518901 [Fusarium oxysporum]